MASSAAGCVCVCVCVCERESPVWPAALQGVCEAAPAAPAPEPPLTDVPSEPALRTAPRAPDTGR